MSSKDVFTWTDELVLRFAVKWLNDRVAWAIMHDFAAAPPPVQIELKEFKEQQSKRLVKKSNTKDVFEWTDELVKEFCEWDKTRIHTSVDTIYLFKQSKQPIKPDTKEERIEVSNFMSDTHHRICIMDTSSPIPKEKYPSIKAAIESVLNNEEIKQVNFKDGYWVHPDMLSKMSEITGKIYTQQQLDEAIQKAEKDAWNFAREKMIIDGKPTERQYRFLSYYEYEIYKKSSEILYQRSLQDNSNSKTYNHVK